MVPDENGDRPSGELTAAQALSQLAARVAALERQVADLYAAAPVAAPVAPPIAPPIAGGPHVSGKTGLTAAPPLPPRTSFENRLGSQVFNRIGIVALLIGVTWFLKLAVDNGWLGPIGRVVAGLLAGAVVILWSERFRRSGFAAFSYSLKAIGSGVLYLSLWAAFQLYDLLPASAALGAMLLVTAWNAWMAWSQDAELLAAYALAGGLATPLLLSTGGNHQVFLFSYLLGIDLAAVLLVRLKPWPRLFLAAFPTTVAYYAAWYVQFHQASPLALTLLFLAAFFLLFAAPVLLLAPGQQTPQIAASRGSLLIRVVLPIANAALAAFAVYVALEDAGYHYLTPWTMLLFGAIYLGLMRLRQPAVTSAVHLSLAIVFVTITIPLKASGRWITVAWLVEGVALLWTSTRFAAFGSDPAAIHSPAPAFDRPLRALSSAALLLGLLAVLWDILVLPPDVPAAFLNRRFATAVAAVAAYAISASLALRARGSRPQQARPTFTEIAGASVIALNLVALLAVVKELGELWPSNLPNSEAELQKALAISAFLMVYGAVLLAVGFWKRSGFVRWQALALLVFSIAKTFLYDMRNLSQGYRVVSFLGLGALLMAVSFAYQKDWLALREPAPGVPPDISEVQP